MRLLVSLIIAVAFILPSFAFDIVVDGKAAAVVVVDPKGPKSSEKAASEFVSYVEKMTGVKLQISDGESESLPVIRIGAPCNAKFTDEIRVFVNANGELEITGQAPRGPAYAVYKFLETFGVRYWSPWRETVPEVKTLRIPNSFKISYHPPFDSRSGWSISDCGHTPAMQAWRVKVGHNGSVIPAYGGSYQFTFGETITYKFMKPKKYFDAHPEWYALVNGTRKPTQLCVSNEDCIDAFEAEIREELKAKPDLRFISVVSADNNEFCQCKGCMRIRSKMNGGPAALEVYVANEMARRFHKEYPELHFTVLAYWDKERAPQRCKLENNVSVGLALGHTQNLPVSKCKQWQEIAQRWEKLAQNRIYIWDYYAGFNNFHEPRADFYNIAETMRYYRDHKYKGVSAQLALGRTSNFGELKAYIWAQFAWNPDQNIDAMISEYIKCNFGDGAPFVQKYWEQNLRLMRTSKDVKMRMYGMNYDNWYRARDMFNAWELVHKALEATKDDPVSYKQCQYLYVSVLTDFLLRWDRQNITVALHRYPNVKPTPDRSQILADLEEILTKYPEFYFSEHVTWKVQLAKFKEQEKERLAKMPKLLKK